MGCLGNLALLRSLVGLGAPLRPEREPRVLPDPRHSDQISWGEEVSRRNPTNQKPGQGHVSVGQHLPWGRVTGGACRWFGVREGVQGSLLAS